MKSSALPLFAAASLVSGQALAEHIVQYDNPLIPVGLRPGDSFHLVFATSNTTNRDSGGGADNFPISQWNTFVDNAAAASTVSAIQPTLAAINWKAIVSTKDVNARDNALVEAPVYRLDGALVATGFADMWDGSITTGIQLTQNLTLVPGAQSELTWSGSTSAGLKSSTNPLGNGTVSALTGRASVISGGWIAGSGAEVRDVTTSLRMYALSEKITIETPPDSDGDGLPDWFEQAFTDPSSTTSLSPTSDLDQDGLTALQEYNLDTRLNPGNPDTDGDKLLDGASITVTNSDSRYTSWATLGIAYSDNGAQRTFRGESTMSTDPLKPDTDADGLPDGAESNSGVWVSSTNTGTDPLKADTDGDALKDGIETNTGVFVGRTSDTGTNPLLADTDGDGASDWYEATASLTNPNSAVAPPSIPYPLPKPNNSVPAATDKPVKVFILSGQSNMVGIGYVGGPKPGSLDVITKQEGKFPNLLDDNKNYLSREDVWYEGVYTATAKKWLAPGCGGDSTRIGPELGFGQVMGWFHDEPVLIIKASQGNRGLGWDILPPGSTSFPWTNGKTYAGYGDSPASWTTGTTPIPGSWYGGKEFDQFFKKESDWARPGDAPMYNVADVLDEFETKFPQWAAQGFEIAGYAWFQGHWDQSEPYASKYEENLVRLIQQVRSYYQNRYPGKVVTDAPFAVASIGFGYQTYENPASPQSKVLNAQLNVGDPVKYPQFAGNVKSIDTRPYWRELNESPGVQGYHYNNNAETYMLVGDALGRIMVDMLEGDDTFPPSPNPLGFQIPPSAIDSTTIGMVATTATDRSGPVEYFFECTAGGGPDSTWQESPSFTVTGLAPGTNLTYRVKARDSVSPVRNETGWSAEASATAAADNIAPSPNPMSFAVPPTATGETSITMTASTAIDINGVEYFFECTSGGGPNSGWQDNPVFNTTSLTTGLSYTYVVRARDKSTAQNVTADSPAASATPEAIPDTTPPATNYLEPVTGTTGVPTNATLTIAFSENVTTGSGFITLKNLSDATQAQIAVGDSSQVVFSGDTVTITPAGGFIEGKNYAVRIDATAIGDLAGNQFAGITNDTTWGFTIVDASAPLASAFSPANGTPDVLPTAPLVITFNEPVVRGTGFITIKNLTDGTETQIDVTNTSRVAVSGSTVTITPATGLAQQKLHAVRIDSGAIKDSAGNSFAGIANDSTWTFTTRLVVGATSIPLHDFETALDPWIPNSVASTGLYIHQTQLQPTDDTATNFACGGTKAASLGKAGGAIVSPVLDLSGGGTAESLTVDLGFVWHNGSSTRRAYVEYSNDGGSTWFTIAMMQIGAAGASTNKVAYSGSVTIKEGLATVTRTGNLTSVTLTGHTPWNNTAQFTNNSKIRISNLASAGADARLFIDNLSVASTITPPIAGNPFDDWAGGYPALTNTDPSLDFDGGSLPTGIEWVAGGNPADGNDDAGLAPTLDATSDPNGKLLFTFRRTAAAKNDASTTIAVQYGGNLAGWTTAVHQGTGPGQITIMETPNGFGTGIDKVTVALPPSLAPAGKLFVRLNVSVAAE